jgi:RNA polymerase sigma factor (sigma-70 family)
MESGQLAPVLRYLRRVGGAAEEDGDRALLERFAHHRDAEAFAVLVRRHGPMVLGVCRRILHNGPDADDAFQAAFLLLVRKAASLRRPELLGPWLHGVARRVALKARALGLRRGERLEPLPELPGPPALDTLVWRDLRPVLDDAVRSLPAKYRTPFILCYLQGLTQAEAARQLGCPPSTVATRLSRAREHLRRRLLRRGVTISAAVLATGLAGSQAAVPYPLLAGAGAVSWSVAIPPQVTALMEGVCRAMLMEKLRFVVMALVAAAAAGCIFLGYRSGAAEPPAASPPAAVPRLADPEEATVARTRNFEVTAPTGRVARLIAEAAERHRKEQATLWLGKELPAWAERCPIDVKFTMGGVGGATAFSYDAGKVQHRTMHLEGPLDRLLASALPHEVTHTVLADYFGAPPPRWADEGACVLSEDEEEQRRHSRLMGDIAAKPRFIPASRLVGLKEFPEDVMVLYVEGYALTRFLVDRKDRRTFLAFVKQGMQDGWDRAVKEQYGFRDIDALERAWLGKPAELDFIQRTGMPVVRSGLPEEGPVPGVARLQNDGKDLVLKLTRTKMQYSLCVYRYRDGRSVDMGLKPTVANQPLEATVPFSEVQGYRADGSVIEASELSALLARKTPVLVAPSRSAFHAQWLGLIRPDALLLVVAGKHLSEKGSDEEVPTAAGR